MQLPAYAPDPHGREVEQAIVVEVLRADDGTRWSHDQLADRLKHIEPQAVSEALARLNRRNVIRVEEGTIEALNSAEQRQRLDALSGVVVHVLVCAHPRTVALAEVAEECERDLDQPEERHEIELALRWVVGDELACRQDGWIATRPAVRAAELSF